MSFQMTYKKQSVILSLLPTAGSKDQFRLPFSADTENGSVPPSANPEGIGITQPRVS